MKCILQTAMLIISFFLLWQFSIYIFHFPPYILPSPISVFHAGYNHFHLILVEAKITIIETLLGLFLGTLFACFAALSMAFFRHLSIGLLPILIISQAIPTFAIAPLLVIWLGYGMTSKIATTIIMIFFPIASAFYDGLRQTEEGWIDLGKIMHAKKWRFFYYIRIPSALPQLASGIRIATVFSPMGAVIGEWVGSSQGLGFLMLNFNARMQIDLMFAALFTLIIFSLTLYFVVDRSLKYAIYWQV